jgi:hypothetical protein
MTLSRNKRGEVNLDGGVELAPKQLFDLSCTLDDWAVQTSINPAENSNALYQEGLETSPYLRYRTDNEVLRLKSELLFSKYDIEVRRTLIELCKDMINYARNLDWNLSDLENKEIEALISKFWFKSPVFIRDSF